MLVSSPYVLDSVPPIHAGQQLASTVEDDESLEKLLIQLLCNLSGFKNNQQKLGACMRVVDHYSSCFAHMHFSRAPDEVHG